MKTNNNINQDSNCSKEIGGVPALTKQEIIDAWNYIVKEADEADKRKRENKGEIVIWEPVYRELVKLSNKHNIPLSDLIVFFR